MQTRRFVPAAAFLSVLSLALSVGCQTAPPPRVVAPPEVVREAPTPRRPSLAGDVLVYPCQWRNAEELGFRLYSILYPKYGTALQIVPDPVNNVLLVYLPKKAG